MIEYFFLPLLGFLIALIGIFFDAKGQDKSFIRTTLIFLLVLTSIGSGWTSWDKNKKSDQAAMQALYDRDVLQKTLFNVSSKLGDVGHGVDAIAEFFGLKKDNISPAVLAESINADAVLARLITDKSVEHNRDVTVQYYPKDVDRALVQSALLTTLTQAGFLLKSGVAKYNRIPTNSVFYGADVPVDSVKVVALALTRAGVKIRGIQPLSDPTNSDKAKLIEIASYGVVKDNPVYTAEQISTLALKR